jgi:coatomer subunit beta
MIVSMDCPGSPQEIKTALEGNDMELKVDMLKKAIAMSLSGDTIPGLFICMIRYVLPSSDHTVQRLLLLYLVRALVNTHIFRAP